jgi:hypothetical protein
MAIRLRQRGAVLRETLPTPPFTYRIRKPAIPGRDALLLYDCKNLAASLERTGGVLCKAK